MSTTPALTNLETPSSRAALAHVVARLFRYWKLDKVEQLDLLGFNARSYALLSRFHRGAPVRISHDTLDRIGWLLSIHKSLKIIYPHNELLRRQWIHRRNFNFENHSPVEVMCDGGLVGIARVAQHLELRLAR